MAYGHLLRSAHDVHLLLLSALAPADLPPVQPGWEISRPRAAFFEDTVGMPEYRLRGYVQEHLQEAWSDGPIKLNTAQEREQYNALMKQMLKVIPVSSVPGAVSYQVTNIKTGQVYEGGTFCMPSMGILRQETQNVQIVGQKGKLTLLVRVESNDLRLYDIGALQATAESGTTFQVATNYNCLETTSAKDDPAEHGISSYINDWTQGPYAVISASPGLLGRLYVAAPNVLRNPQGTYADWAWGSPDNPDINLLDELEKRGYLYTKNGYITSFNQAYANQVLPEELIKIGLHSRIQPVFGYLEHPQTNHLLIDPQRAPRINQVFFTTLDVGQKSSPFLGQNTGLFASNRVQLFLDIAYEGCLRSALYAYKQAHQLKNTAFVGNGKVVLTLMGGGVFCNRADQIITAIARQADLIKESGLDVTLVIFSAPQYGWKSGKKYGDQSSMADLRNIAAYIAGTGPKPQLYSDREIDKQKAVA